MGRLTSPELLEWLFATDGWLRFLGGVLRALEISFDFDDKKVKSVLTRQHGKLSGGFEERVRSKSKMKTSVIMNQEEQQEEIGILIF